MMRSAGCTAHAWHSGVSPRAEPRLDQRTHPLERDLGVGVVELVEVQVARIAARSRSRTA